MKSRFLTVALFCALLLGTTSLTLHAESDVQQLGTTTQTLSTEPEALESTQLRQEMMQNPGPVVEYVQTNLGGLQKKVQDAVASGTLKGPEDMKALLAVDAKEVLSKSVEFRKTLKEPEYRLKLDAEMLQLGASSGLIEEVVGLLNNWKASDIKESLIVNAAQMLQQSKTPFTPEFDALLNEVAKSKDPKMVQFAERMLNEFFRNPVGKAFPAFPTGKKTTDGQDLNLERFKGKILLVDFWATWCPPCRAEVEPLVKVYKAYKDKGFEIVGISFDKEKTAFDDYLKENEMTWPQYYDGKYWDNEVGPTYGIQSIPAMYLLDKEGKVISTELRGGKLEEELAKILK